MPVMEATPGCARRSGFGAPPICRHPAADLGVGARNGATSAPAWSGRGRPPLLTRRDAEHRPVQRQGACARPAQGELAEDSLPRRSAGPLTSRFAAVRVRAAHRELLGQARRDEEWLLIEWPEGDDRARQILVGHRPAGYPVRPPGRLAKLRWRIERDYQELKQELGLGHYEGRGWRGFHHHATLCIAAYAFLIAERADDFPLSRRRSR